jgi:asparagine synthase (glutamine-hydrolysing)
MCGIFTAIAAKNDLVFTEEEEKIVTKELSHRGPDQHGFFRNNKIWMSNYRLNITGGVNNTQPIADRSKKIFVIFNGEIYNYLLLKKMLADMGTTFNEPGDTPVILHAYLRWGTDFVSKLDGQFAIIIYDMRINKIFAFRDRFGEKPLYYSYYKTNIFISSEVSPISKVSKKNLLNSNSISDLLVLGYIQDPDSIYSEIMAVPAGYFLTVSDQKKILTLWDNRRINKSNHTNIHTTTNDVKLSLKASISERIPSEVSSAILLSGGIDSTLIAILAKEMGFELDHLTTSFRDPVFDESNVVKKITAQFGLKSNIVELLPPTLEDLSTIIKTLDEPIAEPSFFAAYKLGLTAKLNNNKVVLNGDGADELFGGYPTYRVDTIIENYGQIFNFLLKTINYFSNIIPNGNKPIGNKEILKRINTLKYDSNIHTHFAWRFYFRPDIIEKIFPGISSFLGADIDIFRHIEDNLHFKDPINSMMYVDQYSWLTSGHLRKADRAFMLNSVESRSPFLSNDLVKLSDNLHSTSKVDIFSTKKILRQILKEYVGKDIYRIKKRGWTMPLENWTNKSINKFMEPILEGSFFRNFMSENDIRYLFQNQNNHTSDKFRVLWSMLVLEIWLANNNWSL